MSGCHFHELREPQYGRGSSTRDNVVGHANSCFGLRPGCASKTVAGAHASKLLARMLEVRGSAGAELVRTRDGESHFRAIWAGSQQSRRAKALKKRRLTDG